METLEQRALTGLGGGKVSRKGGTPLLEAGGGLEQLSLALGSSGSASGASLRLGGGEVRGQGGAPVGTVGWCSMRGKACGLGLTCNRGGAR